MDLIAKRADYRVGDPCADTYVESDVCVRVVCPVVHPGWLCGDAMRTGLRAVGDVDRPVYRVEMHDGADASRYVLIGQGLHRIERQDERRCDVLGMDRTRRDFPKCRCHAPADLRWAGARLDRISLRTAQGVSRHHAHAPWSKHHGGVR